MKTCSVAACLLLAAGVAAAQQWVLERVDSAPWGASVEIAKHPDGRLFVCYENRQTLELRAAFKDSVGWHHEETGLVAQGWPVPPGASLAVSRTGEVGITVADSSERLRYIWRTDTGWTSVVIPSQYPTGQALAFDSAGNPCIAFGLSVPGAILVQYATRFGSVWSVESVHARPRSGDLSWMVPYDLVIDRRGQPQVMFEDFEEWFLVNTWWQGLYRAWKDADSWCIRVVAQAGGHGQMGTYLRSFALAVDTASQVSICYTFGTWPNGPSDFLFDGTRLDEGAGQAAAVYDDQNRPHVVYSDRDVRYRMRLGGYWLQPRVIPGTGAAYDVDMVVSDSGQPIVAFSDSLGVWVAYGIDVTGEEERPAAEVRLEPVGATVVSGVLHLRAGHGGVRHELLDLTGRRVMALVGGQNDVRRLGAGVYFVRLAGEPGVRKVVIQH